jgi:transposase
LKQNHIYPDWVLKHRKPATELRFINNTYYLYQVSSEYDPVKKKGKKKTGALLGKITKELGFIESAKKQLKEKAANSVDYSKISIREFGFTNFLEKHGKQIEQKLQQYFPKYYKQIIYMAYCRLVHNSPINRMPIHINKSMLSLDEKEEFYPKKLSDIMTNIGIDRHTCVKYMSSFVSAGDHILVDMTNMFSGSEKMIYSKEGYNSDMVFDTQINLMYIYSPTSHQPLFYRLLNGNTREVKGFKMCLEESGIKDAILIADKGFYSKANIKHLEQNELQYIIPLKRDSALIDYNKLNEQENEFFKYEDRIIWMVSYEAEVKGEKKNEVEKVEVKLFRDDKLRVQEQKDYLQRIESNIEGYTRESFNKKLPQFGTFALVSNLKNTVLQEVYAKYKSRNSIEVMFDGVKTILKADTTYMQREETLNGWMFINHIALQWYYIIYNLLVEKKLLSKYSVKQFITELAEHRKVNINGEWREENMIASTEKMLKKLELYSVN